ncbi:MAG: hypothetical protein ABSA48_01025 [Terracidiphilus sp.]
MLYSHESSAAIGEVSPAAWVEVDVPTIDFDAGVTHCAVLAAFTQGQWGGCRVASQQTSWGDTAYSIENPVRPREWFLVPLFVVNEVVERIKDGTITQYVYDPTAACLVKAAS